MLKSVGSVIINTTVVSQRLLSVIVQEYVPQIEVDLFEIAVVCIGVVFHW